MTVVGERRAEVAELFREYRRTGDRTIRNRLVEQHLSVPDYYVRRYSGRGVPSDDLRQVALLTMLRSIDRFDVYSADEMFATGTGAEVIAVTRVDGRVIGSGVAGPITSRLLETFRRHVREG